MKKIGLVNDCVFYSVLLDVVKEFVFKGKVKVIKFKLDWLS